MTNPLLSVVLVTYNQEKYIRSALDGAVKQQCSFPFEILIGEDCSTDGTRSICQEFADSYPDIVRLLPSTSHNLGLNENFLRTYRESKGKYIAYLEGDDFWIDTQKLQKQVDILELQPEVVLVHTNCKLWDVATGKVSDHMINYEGTCIRERQSGISGVECEYIGKFRHVKTSTCVYRKEIMDKILTDDLQAYSNPEFMAQDVQLFLDMAYHGRYAFIDEDTTVIALTDTLSVSSNPQKALNYRLSYHKIGRYYISKYNLRTAIQQPWLQREMHWMLNFGMRHTELAPQVSNYYDSELALGYPPSILQRILATIIRHPMLQKVSTPLYNVYYRQREK